MGAANLTSLSGAIKQMWPENRLMVATYKKNPAWAMLRKRFDFKGTPARVATRYGDITGRSATFANAQADANPTSNAGWLITGKNDYAVATIDGETIDVMDGEEGAVIGAIESEMDSAVNGMNRSMGRMVFGRTVGTIGKITVITGPGVGAVLTLDRQGDLSNFEVGMTIGAVSNDTGTGTQRVGTTTVTGVNRQASTVTLADSGAIAAIAVGDFLFPDGDYNKRMSGFRDWIPDSDPSATLYYSVDRTADIQRLGGLRYDATTAGESIEEALQHASAQAASYGGDPRVGFMNPIDIGNLLVALGTRQYWVETKVAGIAFKGITVSSPDGEITIYSDYNCPQGRACLFTMDSWFGFFRKKPCRIIENVDGLTLLRAATSDSYETRLVTRGNLVCTVPGHNVNLKLTA